MGCENHLRLSSFGKNVVLGAVLITVSVSANNDGLGPAGYESRDIADNNWFAEDSTVKYVSDGSVG